MAIIDVLKYDGPNNALVWKWRSDSNKSRGEELRYGTQLVVNQSQEACFVKGGQLLEETVHLRRRYISSTNRYLWMQNSVCFLST
jgi:membrane protease subunit (stomatin/prohibitin family)